MGGVNREKTMRKALIITALFALAQLGRVPVALSAPPQTEPAAEVRGGEGMHGGGGFRGGEGFRGGGARGGAPGGEFRERGEHGEDGEFREHERHERHGGGFIVAPGYGYYPYSYYPYGYPYPNPEYEEGPEYEEPGYLLYCDDPQGYYPYVAQCPDGWEEMPQ